ncbi:acyltransferase family protein [Azoarcus olearius]|uniref:Acyltransferase n=1 Tax=Azoarcus sp. (strain BH72) TaxID=418699 RepID=A1KAL5_AZOSB|nr:acyltransferase family protein [Azoarcus olearius]CAL95871.1 acyltransferase [Azoarcus olearius]
MSTPQLHALPYRPEVDGLRAFAVVPVILFHAGLESFSGGFVGVDVFFVISGYLITSIILSDHARHGFSLVRFYERRARRILPALFAVIACCLPFAWRWMTPDELAAFGKSIVAVTLFSSNILFWRSSGYFDSSTEEKPLLHTWSLGVEEQYYVLFPLLLMLTWRFGKRRQAWMLAGIGIASLVLCEWGSRIAPDATFYLAPTRAWELLIGSMLAFASSDRPLYDRVTSSSSAVLATVGVLMILAAVFTYDEHVRFPSAYALVPTLGTALVLAFAHKSNRVGRLLSSRGVVIIGLLSYSAYLWHQPLFAFARLRSAERPSVTVFLLLSIVVFALAYVTWRYVEAPFRNRRRIARGPVFALSLVGTAAFFLVGLTGPLSAGLPSRLDAEHQALLATATPSPKRDECHAKGEDYLPPSRACTYFNANVTWAVFGDSHTVEPAYALAQYLAARGQGLLHLSFSGCGPSILYDNRTAGCSRWQNEALLHIEASPHIRDVLIGFRYSAALFGDHASDYPNLPDNEPRIDGQDGARSRELIWRSFSTIVERLQKAGKRVFVLGPIPELPRPVQQNIFAGQFKDDAAYHNGTSRAYFDARHRYILNRLDTLAWSDRLVRIDPVDVLCDNGSCRAVIDREAMYFDDDHLSVAGARRVLQSLQAYIADGPPPSDLARVTPHNQ